MSSAGWYWHRFKAMSTLEVAGRIRKTGRSFADKHSKPNWEAIRLETRSSFPSLRPGKEAPEQLRQAVIDDAAAILKGEWTAFGGIPLRVDDPPKWHCDYLAHQDLATSRSAFELDHRRLPGGADIKLIWELSRWFQLARLAQASWLAGDKQAFAKCIAWLRHWIGQNPAYHGWNWTSALESGIRLIQYTWIDAFLSDATKAAGSADELMQLRKDILPAHAWFTWRHKSFGSSANNHLLGELSGLIVATSRWPALAGWATPMQKLHQLWEREVLAQFANDGGNLEQALNYHLFSFEFAWHARTALRAAGLETSAEVEERLGRAASFFLEAQSKSDPWDYGDSDNAYVTPLFVNPRRVVEEWYAWFDDPTGSPGLRYYLGDSPKKPSKPSYRQLGAFRLFPETGIAVAREGAWRLRWDLSPLGYLSTAAHGHLDALHVSIWFKGKALVIDPGTGAYYADRAARDYLASWEAHNGPRLDDEQLAVRLGSFLWSRHHNRPIVEQEGTGAVAGRLPLNGKTVTRAVKRLAAGWEVSDTAEPPGGTLKVRWQFPPGAGVSQLNACTYRIERDGVPIWIQLAEGTIATLVKGDSRLEENSLAGLCSPSFRTIDRGPFLDITNEGHKPCLLRTTFLASPPS